MYGRYGFERFFSADIDVLDGGCFFDVFFGGGFGESGEFELRLWVGREQLSFQQQAFFFFCFLCCWVVLVVSVVFGGLVVANPFFWGWGCDCLSIFCESLVFCDQTLGLVVCLC